MNLCLIANLQNINGSSDTNKHLQYIPEQIVNITINLWERYLCLLKYMINHLYKDVLEKTLSFFNAKL